jgi:hypothetical protein
MNKVVSRDLNREQLLDSVVSWFYLRPCHRGRIWKEAVVAYSRYYPYVCVE